LRSFERAGLSNSLVGHSRTDRWVTAWQKPKSQLWAKLPSKVSYSARPELVEQMRLDLRRTEIGFTTLEFIRVALAKHEVSKKGNKKPIAFAPGRASESLVRLGGI
jgi:hypothetical protein